jgi:TolA-binding protein
MVQSPYKRWWVALLAVVALLGPAALPARAETPDEQLAAASALFDAKRYADAAQRLEAFLTANPKHAKFGVAAFTQARCYAELKQYPKAVPAYEKAVASKDPAILTVAQLGLGEAALYAQQYDKAAAALGAAVKSPLKPEQAPVGWYLLAQAQFQLEKYPAAEEAYARVTREYPKSEFIDSAYYGAGLAAARQGKAEVARQYLKTVVERYPKSGDRPQAALVLAQLDVDAKRYREARPQLEALLRDAAAPAETKQAAEESLTTVLLELQDYAAATSRLEAVIGRLPAADPQRFRAQLSLGHCRYRQKQYPQALSAYLEAAKSTEGDVAGEGHYWAGNASLALNRPTDAAAQFDRLLARFPKHALAARAQLKEGDALLAAKQGEAASTAYRTVIEKFPQAPEAAEAKKALAGLLDAVSDPAQLAAALKNAPPAERARGNLRLARLYLTGKKFSEAEAPLQEVLKSKPEPAVTAEAQYLLGLAQEAQSRPAPAAVALAEAVKLAPTAEWAGDAQGRLAWLYLELKQAVNAERAANAALAAKPAAEAERQARLALIQAEIDQQKWDLALDGCKSLLATNPPKETIATLLYTQAWVNEKREKPDEALPLWERLVAEYPKSDYTAEAFLHLGDARFRAEKWEEAKDRYNALLTGFSQSPLAGEARFKLGSTLFQLERYPEAAAEWDRASADKTAGDYVPEALYWAGVALDKAGKKEDALQRLTRLVTQFPKHMRVANAKVRLAALKAVTGK